MTIAHTFLHEFEHEARTTRRFLEQLPAGKMSWKPHEKSLSAGQLALHIASAPGGIIGMAMEDEVPAPDFKNPFPEAKSVDEVLAAHDASVQAVKQQLPTLSDAQMGQTWRMMKDGSPVLEVPRAAMIRTILMNHIIQHRGQFGVYLRIMGAKVPSSYGPSGDEMPEFMKSAAAVG
ncbi:MAG: DinB family protein [Phycisphaerales bacterium]|nr:DinB family protein [Phycisphaerales bacterium]MCB9855236.1 DinB family protein [Phycisphaerales bacterium]MCB9862829.1 DinB family protein [Phycisphaerales bacterium]